MGQLLPLPAKRPLRHHIPLLISADFIPHPTILTTKSPQITPYARLRPKKAQLTKSPQTEKELRVVGYRVAGANYWRRVPDLRIKIRNEARAMETMDEPCKDGLNQQHLNPLYANI